MIKYSFMKEIREEFENYLKEVIESFPKATTTIRKNPLSLNKVGNKSRDFNSKNKIAELTAKHPFASGFLVS